LIDARSLTDRTHLKTDLCIIGAGAAGITLARALRHLPVQICVLESGGLGYEPTTQALYEGENVGVGYWPLSAARVRFFGGTTNHWGGVCLPLEVDDFEAREWVADSGWPFTREHLLPWYRRAQSLFDIGPYAYGAEEWLPGHERPLPVDAARVLTEVVQVSAARFGTRYRNELRAADNLRIFLHANVLEIETDAVGTQVSRVRAACLGGPHFTVSARIYVMALGGIENARLLLLSQGANPSGLGNGHDLVGRYFSDHPYLSDVAQLIVPDVGVSTAAYEGERQKGNMRFLCHLKLTPEVRRKERLLSTRLVVQPLHWSRHSPGVRRLSRLREAILVGGTAVDRVARGLIRAMQDLDEVAIAAYHTTHGGRRFRIGAWTETVPNRASRVRLGEQLDAFGQRRVVLDWRIGQQESRSIARTLEIIGAEIGRSGLGRLRLNFDPDTPVEWGTEMTTAPHPGLHHMGTTRMHPDPSRGVVDEHCRVHGIANLFIAGSSVFPTYGHANPTLTIGALALRLADHLKSRLEAQIA